MSAVGDDSRGQMILQYMREMELSVRGVVKAKDTNTGTYLALLDGHGGV